VVQSGGYEKVVLLMAVAGRRNTDWKKINARREDAKRIAGQGWSETPVLEKVCNECGNKECAILRSFRRSCKLDGFCFAPKACPYLCEHVVGGQD
jgi:hypothetical protein